LKRRVALLTAAVAALIVIAVAVVAFIVTRHRVVRHRVFRAAPAEHPPVPPTAQLRGINDWSEQFRSLEANGRWGELSELLDKVAASHPNEYRQWQLAYLHARAAVENDNPKNATPRLAPYLANGNPFRDLALFHQADVDDTRGDHAAAGRDRQALIFAYPNSLYRDQAIDDEVEFLKNPQQLAAFSSRIYATAPPARRRDLDAHLVEALVRAGAANVALPKALAILGGGTLDDAAERVSHAIDRPDLVKRLNAQQLALLGTAMQNHRHFDRAAALLSAALNGLPQKHDEILFAIGRSWYGDEKYAQAQQTYMRGANQTRDVRWKAKFLFHASRCAQLLGDDATSEKLMTATIALPLRNDDTSSALTQRIRTRVKQRRFAEAAADLNAMRAMFPRDHALVEASFAYATGMLGAGNNGAALVTLNAIPRNLLDKFEPYEVDYWRARALEASNPSASFAAYLNVLRATMPTHFAYFTRQRLDTPAMQAKLRQEIASRDAEERKQIAAGNWDAARKIETDRYLLSPRDASRLAQTYAHVPAYARVLSMRPGQFPHFPLPPNASRDELLMAMGLFDEAKPKYHDLLTQSLALNRGNDSKDSIFNIEVMMKSVPNDYVPQLLPLPVKQLLYPRYFFDFISDDARRFDADPTLILAIMREESRFNPRAKSEAAARGLLQFIITTARDIGRDAGLVDVTEDDLYDPRVIIRLGAKYVSKLAHDLGGNRYEIAAAYNAGPRQVALWSRLAPASGDDFFLSSINFDETKQYVRKVMNSYRRYEEIYGNAGPQGGVRAEP